MHSPRWSLEAVARYWDAVGPRYLDLFRDEFDAKPHDQRVLRDFAAALGRGATMCDAGCGPCGHVAEILVGAGARVTGVDLSPACIALARRERPALAFEVADAGDLPFASGTLDGVVSYYALHYEPKRSTPRVLREFARVLRPGGRLLIVAKEGSGEGWIPDPLGVAGPVFWASFTAEELAALAVGADFRVSNVEVRDPLRGEAAVRRIYLVAERP